MDKTKDKILGESLALLMQLLALLDAHEPPNIPTTTPHLRAWLQADYSLERLKALPVELPPRGMKAAAWYVELWRHVLPAYQALDALDAVWPSPLFARYKRSLRRVLDVSRERAAYHKSPAARVAA